MKRYVFFVLIVLTSYIGFSFSYGVSSKEISNEAKQHFIKGKKLIETAASPSDFVEAEKEFEKTIELAPNWAEAYYNLALISAEIGKPVKAIKAYERYLEITKNPADKSEVLSEISRLKKIRETKKRIGLSGVSIVAMQDGVYLMNVLPGSKLAKAGFMSGDKIIEVNKRSTVGITLEDFYRLIDESSKDSKHLSKREMIENQVVATTQNLNSVRIQYAKRQVIENPVFITIIRGGNQQVITASLDVFKSYVYEIEEDEFDDEVIKNTMPTLVVFWVDWCSFCKNYIPVIEGIAEKNKGKVAVVSINCEINKKISEKFKIMAFPTTILFKEGKQVGSIIGYKDEAVIEKLLNIQNIKGDSKSLL
jgi:thioredoxin 1